MIASLTRKPVGFMQSCCCHSRSGSQGCFLRENDGDNMGDDMMYGDNNGDDKDDIGDGDDIRDDGYNIGDNTSCEIS